MTAIAAGAARTGRGIGSRVGRFWAAISAVGIKELRGRMRGRRAFAVLTVYLLLLGLFSFGVYFYLKQQALTGTVNNPFPSEFPGAPFPGGQTLSNGTALSAAIGHAIFSGLLMVETLLVLVLAPAFTTGAISLEREKQTLDMLVTTPLSTMGMIVGKLFSALTYVFLLILASIPFASLVFVFGGVGPEDLVRAYAYLFALAFGMGALGLFVSALVKRTQTATVITFVLVLFLSLGTAALHQFWQVAGRQTTSSSGLLLTQRGRAPDALVWLNPFVADLDMVCATAPDSYHDSCEYISSVTGRPYFGSPTPTSPPFFPTTRGDDGVVNIEDFAEPPVPKTDPGPVPDCPQGADCMPGGTAPGVTDVGVAIDIGQPGTGGSGTNEQVTFGFPRDTFWPKSAAAFVALGIILTLLSAQLVSPTRRLHVPGLRRRARTEPPTNEPPADHPPTNDQPPAIDQTPEAAT